MLQHTRYLLFFTFSKLSYTTQIRIVSLYAIYRVVADEKPMFARRALFVCAAQTTLRKYEYVRLCQR